VENAAAAWETLQQLKRRGFRQIQDSAAEQAFYYTRWPGRFDIIAKDPFVLLDGAHNPAGAGALKESLVTYFPGEKFQLVFGVFRDKDITGILEQMLPLASRVCTVRASGERGMDSGALAELIRSLPLTETLQIPVSDGGDVENVLQKIFLKNPPEKTVVFGSLSFLSHAYRFRK
jgi:dihydrofolate synthase/folylpolyglutamate synthase